MIWWTDSFVIANHSDNLDQLLMKPFLATNQEKKSEISSQSLQVPDPKRCSSIETSVEECCTITKTFTRCVISLIIVTMRLLITTFAWKSPLIKRCKLISLRWWALMTIAKWKILMKTLMKLSTTTNSVRENAFQKKESWKFLTSSTLRSKEISRQMRMASLCSCRKMGNFLTKKDAWWIVVVILLIKTATSTQDLEN